jgi:hypothetical protein
MVVILKEQGIETSAASLSRFIKRYREKKLLNGRDESKATVIALAEGAKDGRLREGTLEAVRQRLYERALESQSPEEARELYAELVKEEAKLRELQLKERQVAIAEEQLKLEALVARSKLAGTAGTVKGEVIESKAEPGAIAEAEVNQLAGPSENEKRLVDVVRLATQILNRGGAVEERLLARCVLTEACAAM